VNRPRIELEPVTPWSLRLFDRIRLPAFWVGIAIGLGVFVLFLLYTALLGAGVGRHSGVAFDSGWAAELIQDFFLGFALAITAASVRGTVADFEALRPALEASPSEIEDLRREVLRYRRGLLRVVGVVAGTFSALATVLNPQLWAGGEMPGWLHPTVLWLGGRNFLTWWVILRAMALELMLGSAFSRLAERLGPVDILDATALAPFAQRALRNVSMWMLLAAFISLTFTGKGWAIPSLMLLGLVNLTGFALTAFLLPLLGPHRRLRAAKAEELARARSAIRATRDQVLGADSRELAGGRLADLVAYEARVAAASEWPIGGSTVARLALYLTIGLGSWVGAGLVQHLVETTLR
jgi:hypothetical protein